VQETLEQVKRADPVAPSRLEPGLPRDIETICLACLHKDPARRYASADALADDLGRFSSGESILARATGSVERTWRWCRRNPTVAALSAAVGMLLIALILGSTTAALRLRRARDMARAAEAQRTEQLWASYLAQARAGRFSRRAGQRFDSLKALASAAKIRVSNELRNEAIACLTLVDLRVMRACGATPDPESSLAFDAEVERYAVGDHRGGIRVLRVDDDREIARMPSVGETCIAMGFSPDGRRLAAGYAKGPRYRVLIWDLARRVRVEIGPDARHFGVFSPDGSRFAQPLAGDEVGLFDSTTGAILARSRLAPDSCFGLAYHPDGRRLATIGEQSTTVRVIDPASGEQLWSHDFDTAFGALAWRPDGRLLALGGDDQQIYVWDMAEDRLLSVLDGHRNAVIALAFNHDGRLLISSSWDVTTRLWDPVLGRSLLETPGYARIMQSVHRRVPFTEARYAFTADNHTRSSIWEVADPAVCRVLHHGMVGNRTARPPTSGPTSLFFHPGGRILASTSTDGIRFWDSSSGDELAHMPARMGSIAFSPDGSRLVTNEVTGLRLWPIRHDADVSGELFRFGPASVVEAANGISGGTTSWDGSGRFLAVSVAPRGHEAALLDLQNSGKPIRFEHPGRWLSAVLSPDGRWLATYTWKGRGIRVWDVVRRALAREWEAATAFAAFSPDGRWLVTSAEGQDYRLWHVGSWRPGPSIPLKGVLPLAFSPESTLLALNGLGPVLLVDPASGREVAVLESAAGSSALSFSPDGRQLATGTGEHTILLWDLGRVREELRALGLDWDASSLPPRKGDIPPARVEIVVATGDNLGIGELMRGASLPALDARPDLAALWLEHGGYYATRAQWEKVSAPSPGAGPRRGRPPVELAARRDHP
jgi:WD40 repeat protein